LLYRQSRCLSRSPGCSIASPNADAISPAGRIEANSKVSDENGNIPRYLESKEINLSTEKFSPTTGLMVLPWFS
jgi:hypothetical protein